VHGRHHQLARRCSQIAVKSCMVTLWCECRVVSRRHIVATEHATLLLLGALLWMAWWQVQVAQRAISSWSAGGVALITSCLGYEQDECSAIAGSWSAGESWLLTV